MTCLSRVFYLAMNDDKERKLLWFKMWFKMQQLLPISMNDIVLKEDAITRVRFSCFMP